MDDKFLEWLNKNEEHYALIDKSYKKYKQSKYKLADTKGIIVNTELATYGDAVLKLALCQILWDENITELTERKKIYEMDKTLVGIIAKKYELLNYIMYDKDDANMVKDYDYKDDKHKFIATAVEACLGAIYLEKGMDIVLEIIKDWKDLIDKNNDI